MISWRRLALPSCNLPPVKGCSKYFQKQYLFNLDHPDALQRRKLIDSVVNLPKQTQDIS
jgi:hypothetical protein